METLFNDNKLPKKFKKFKFQIIYISYCYFEELKHNDKKKFNFEYIVNQYSNDEECSKIFLASCEIISRCIKRLNLKEEEAVRSKEFTESLKQEIQQEFSINTQM